MRLPRLLAYYRAEPALDGYSDKQCRKLLLQARLRRGDAAWALPLVAAAAASGFWVFVAVGLVRVFAALLSIAVVGGTFLLALALLVAPVFVATFVGVRRAMLVRSVRRLLSRAACPFCEFSLVGLPVRVNTVRCPECGEEVRLSEHGIRHEDLRPCLPYPPVPPREGGRGA